MSSCTATMASPYNSVYSSTKAYIRQLSKSINFEYSNVDTTVFEPWHIATEMIGKPSSNISIVTPNQLVENAMKHAGLTLEIDPCLFHYIEDWGTMFTPEFIRVRKAIKEFENFKKTRSQMNKEE